MPFRTETYQLEAFQRGDVYSGSTDRRRFLIIDNQLAFLSDRIGDGRIEGWEVYQSPDDPIGVISVSPGMGIISRNVTRTFGVLQTTVAAGRTVNLYIKRRLNVIGGFSPWSNLSSIVGSDTTAPSSPTNFVVTSLDFDYVELKWDADESPDFSFYVVERSLDNISFENIYETNAARFRDEGVSQNTTYYYRVKSVDVSGNEGLPTNSLMVKTLKDLRPPLPPSTFRVFPSNQMAQIFWTMPSFGNIAAYEIACQEYNKANQPVGSPRLFESAEAASFINIRELTNGTLYRISIRSISVNGVYSTPLIASVIPEARINSTEVDSISVVYSAGTNDDKEVIAEVSWSVDPEPYEAMPVGYQIVFFAQTQQSEPVIVRSGFSRVFKLLPFRNANGVIDYRPLSELTDYFVRVQTIDSQGNVSSGSLSYAPSPTFRDPPPVTNLTIQQNSNNSLLAAWINSATPLFSHNILRVVGRNNSTLVETIIEDNVDYGSASSYVLAVTEPNHTYTFELTPFDRFGNEGAPISGTFVTRSVVGQPRPKPPAQQTVISRDGVLIIQWERPYQIQNISFFRIWRAEDKPILHASDYSAIATIPSTLDSFTDYTVEVGKTYVYFVTTIDIFGQESFNPIEDEFISYKTLSAKSTSSSPLGSVEISNITLNGFDAVIEWGAVAGSFDGYEIWRSEGNTYSFKLVGNANASATQFEDKNAILKNDVTYYYLVRRFRNEGDLFVTESSAVPPESLFIAKVSNVDGVISIDQDAMNNIKLLEDPVRKETRRQLASHRHTYGGEGDDRRIDLSSNVTVTSWETRDWQTFQTEEPFGGASAYIVRLIGEVNEKYFTDSHGVVNRAAVEQLRLGIPPFLYEVVEEAGAVIFEVPLYGDQVQYLNPGLYDPILDFKKNPNRGSIEEQAARLEEAWRRLLNLRDNSPIRDILDTERPFLNEPVIEVTMLDVTEVQNTLPASRVGDLDASQVVSGRIQKGQVPAINHDGRIGERLIPAQFDMNTVDRYNYAFADTATVFSNAITFYDILLIRPLPPVAEGAPPPPADLTSAIEDGTALVAARSDGIATSLDYGATWTVQFSDVPFPIHKLFYANTLKQYFGLSNKGVYASDGSLQNWAQMAGTENVKVVRDIVEDAFGNLYISTDLGVYKLDVQFPGLGWEQTPLFGPRSTESYALLYDDVEERLLVSNELGLLESRNEGASWEFIDEFPEFEPIWTLIRAGGVIFALVENEIWRKRDGESAFSRIAVLDCDMARKLTLYNDRLFVVTDESAYQSDVGFDIYNDTSLSMVPTFSELYVRGTYVPATSLNAIEDTLFVGTEERLFFRRGNRMSIQYDLSSGLAPTVYVNGITSLLGCYYRSGGLSLSFDQQQPLNASVASAVDYLVYEAENGGWAMQRYNADLVIKLQGNELYTTVGEDVFNTFDISPFQNFVFPEFDTLNSNLATAEEARVNAQASIDALVAYFGEDGGFDPEDRDSAADEVSSCLQLIQRFFSQLYVSARVIEIQNEAGETFVENAELPSIEISFGQVEVDITKGIFTFGAISPAISEGFSKYDVLTADILKSTVAGVGENDHETIEDYMEDVNSGLPSALAVVKQSATLKMGLFNEKLWPGEQEKLATPYQANYFIPRNRNFYDSLNSSVDYSLRYGSEEIATSLSYASCAVYSESLGKVFVGGYGGLLMIDVETLEMQAIDFPNIENVFIKYLHVESDRVYALTTSQVYESTDGGITWTEISRIGLPDSLCSIARINSNLVIGASDGVYFKYERMETWSKALDSTSPVEVMSDPDVLFVIADEQIYVTADGAIYTKTGGKQSRQINALSKYGSMIFAATDNGLYKDDGTFYGGRAMLTLVDMIGDRTLSSQLIVNDVTSTPNMLFAGISDGSVFMLTEGKFLRITELPIGTVHKVIAVGDEFWAFGYDSFVIFKDDDGINWASFDIEQWAEFTVLDWANFTIDYREGLRTLRPIRLAVGAPL